MGIPGKLACFYAVNTLLKHFKTFYKNDKVDASIKSRFLQFNPLEVWSFTAVSLRGISFSVKLRALLFVTPITFLVSHNWL